MVVGMEVGMVEKQNRKRQLYVHNDVLRVLARDDYDDHHHDSNVSYNDEEKDDDNESLEDEKEDDDALLLENDDDHNHDHHHEEDDEDEDEDDEDDSTEEGDVLLEDEEENSINDNDLEDDAVASVIATQIRKRKEDNEILHQKVNVDKDVKQDVKSPLTASASSTLVSFRYPSVFLIYLSFPSITLS